MRKVILLLVLLASVAMANAQTKDVLYLKNGSVIKGEIIEQVMNENVKIKTADGSIFVYAVGEITKIEKENTSHPDSSSNSFFTSKWRPKGYRGFFELRDGIDFDEGTDLTTFSITTIHGVQLNSHMFVGGGVSLDVANDSYYDETAVTLPVFADFRYSFLNKRVTPYVEERLGYSAGDLSGLYEGIFVGCDFAIKPKFAIYAGLGVTMQYRDFDTDNAYYNLAFNIGLHF